jgi:hypothetical protein
LRTQDRHLHLCCSGRPLRFPSIIRSSPPQSEYALHVVQFSESSGAELLKRKADTRATAPKEQCYPGGLQEEHNAQRTSIDSPRDCSRLLLLGFTLSLPLAACSSGSGGHGAGGSAAGNGSAKGGNLGTAGNAGGTGVTGSGGLLALRAAAPRPDQGGAGGTQATGGAAAAGGATGQGGLSSSGGKSGTAGTSASGGAWRRVELRMPVARLAREVRPVLAEPWRRVESRYCRYVWQGRAPVPAARSRREARRRLAPSRWSTPRTYACFREAHSTTGRNCTAKAPWHS